MDAARASDPLRAAIAELVGMLPDQGPIGVFVHHNTLHAVQHLPFHDGVVRGADLLGARPYPEAERFRAWFEEGRIEAADLDQEIAIELAAQGRPADSPLRLGLTRGELWRLLLVRGGDEADEAGMRFRIFAGLGLPAAAALVDAARARLQISGARAPRPLPRPRRHAEALRLLGGGDVDEVVHPELIRLSASFLDQGQAEVALVGRKRGLLIAVAELAASGFPMPRSAPGLADDLRAVLTEETPADEVLRACLRALGVPEADWASWLTSAATALRGWAGMCSRLERHPEEAKHGPPTTLVEHLAIRLMIERRAVEAEALRLGLPVAWPELLARAPTTARSTPTVDAAMLAQVAEAAGLGGDGVARLDDAALGELWAEIDAAPGITRRRVWLEAFERTYRDRVLSGLLARRARPFRPSSSRPKVQAVFCIDEREEAIRRAIEEQGPRYETFGAAGFFGLAIDFQGLDDAAPAAHCPVVVVPAHEVNEGARDHDLDRHAARAAWRAGWNRMERGFTRLSRTLAGGAGLAMILGPIAGALTATRIFAPRDSVAARVRLDASIAPHPATQLSAIRDGEATTPRGKPLGFSLDEAADRVTAVLKNIGLVDRFAPVVFILGHGSTSLNNPHESAHDCGACGGRRGGANARLFADIVNRSEVREAVAARGVLIPEDTWFVGALHDTSDDGVTLYDLDTMPTRHAEAVDHGRGVLERARRLSAQERCRRFDDAPLGLSPDAALAHVQGRASHLAQPRPEYGHCTNAIAVVGRRTLTRGLHLDRRAFLISYDPSLDRDDLLLERILAAVGPVGAGINLEYYFSSVDNETFGCGTKLPHNVTGLLGVMNGHQGDLRTGLPLQMVEIHEPMRLLLIVEATPASLLAVAGRQAEVRELVVNRWIQLVSCDPTTGALQRFGPGGFEPWEPQGALELPEVERSIDWHGGHRGHLPPALVRAALGEA